MQIIDLPDGQQVTEPGAYRCSMSWYHGQAICPGPSISSSGLRKIFTESPWHFWASSDLNPDRYPEKDASDALILGRAAHSLLLGDEVFDEHFIYVPDNAPSRPTVTQIKAFVRDGKWSEKAAPGAEFWEAFDAKAVGRMLLAESQVETITRIAENLRKIPLAVEMLTGGLTEISMIWQDEITGIWVKSRPDVIPDNGADFADLKTFAPKSKNIQRAVHQAITDHRYDMQLALAAEGARRIFGAGASECVLVMVQTTEPYTVTPVRIDEDTLYWAGVCNRKALDTFARCLKEGHWPMPVEGVLDYALPESLLGRYASMQADGELPNMERF